MRSRSHTIIALALIGAVAAAPTNEAQAGKLMDRFKRSPAAVGAAAAAGTVAALHPVATAGALVGAGAAVGHGALIAGGVVVGGAKVMGTALLAATAVSPLAGVVLAGATVYAGAKGIKFVARKIRERRQARQMRNAGIAGGAMGAGEELSPSQIQELMDQEAMMRGGGQPTMGASMRSPSRAGASQEFDPADFEDFQDEGDVDLRSQYEGPSQLGGPSQVGPSRLSPSASPSLGRGPSAAAPPIAMSRGVSATRSPSLSPSAEQGSPLVSMVHAAPPPSAVAPVAATRSPSRGAGVVAGAAAAGAVVAAPAVAARVPAIARAPRKIADSKSKSGNAQEVFELANGNKVTRTVWGTKNGTQMAHETERSPSGTTVAQRRGKADTLGGAMTGAKVVSSTKTKAGNTKEILEMDDGSRVRVTRWTQGSTPMISVASVDKSGKTIPGTNFQGSEAKYNETLANQ